MSRFSPFTSDSSVFPLRTQNTKLLTFLWILFDVFKNMVILKLSGGFKMKIQYLWSLLFQPATIQIVTHRLQTLDLYSLSNIDIGRKCNLIIQRLHLDHFSCLVHFYVQCHIITWDLEAIFKGRLPPGGLEKTFVKRPI